jgi:hypothetical protein
MAQPGTVSRGFGGRILSIVEATPGTTPTNPAFIKFSDHVQSVSMSFDPQLKEWRDIGDFDVATIVKGLPMYGVRISYLLHTNRKTQLDDAINRQADNSVKSQTIEVSVNRDDTTVGYYRLLGCKAEEANVKFAVGEPVTVEITYKALSATRTTSEPSIGDGSRETAALGALCHASTSAITRGGSALAYITRSAEFKVSHALEAFGTDNQTDPKAILEGIRQVTGTADITVDDGGVTLADAVLAGTAATVIFALGGAGAPKFTLANVQWSNLEIPLSAEQGFVLTGVPFIARGSAAITTGTV